MGNQLSRFKASFCAALLFISLLITTGCFDKTKENYSEQDQTDIIHPLKDKPLAEFQENLLELAFDTATVIPVRLHIKDRSKSQELVVQACLELDQPQRALQYTEKIDNWRKGSCYADLAFYFAKNGKKKSAEYFLKQAEQIAADTEDWRKGRIRVKIAEVHTWLGQNQKASQIEKELENIEYGKINRIEAMIINDTQFETQIKDLDKLISTQTYDVMKNALYAYAELFNTFYENIERRSKIENKIKSASQKMPVIDRVELMMQLTQSALEHKNFAPALSLINETQPYIEDYQWPLEYRISLKSQLISLRYRAGDEEKALADAVAALELFDAKKGSIVNIWRAGALRPLAEAFQSMGHTEKALSVYRRAVEEGVENPNSRPGAEDLSATCVSMALHSVKPDKQLMNRMLQIHKELGHPW